MAARLPSLRAGRPVPPRKIPGIHFFQKLSPSQGHITAGRIRSIERSNYLVGIRTRDLPVCSTVSQPTTLTRAPSPLVYYIFCKVMFALQLVPESGESRYTVRSPETDSNHCNALPLTFLPSVVDIWKLEGITEFPLTISHHVPV
jgi:hypothetical protein